MCFASAIVATWTSHKKQPSESRQKWTISNLSHVTRQKETEAL